MDQTPAFFYNSRLLVDLDRIAGNIEKIRRYTGGTGILPVVKSNAYGFGTAGIARFLTAECGVSFLACAQVYEALQILNDGAPPKDILIIGALPDQNIPAAVANGIQFPVFRKEAAELVSREISSQGKRSAKVHIKIETGLNRIGARPGEELQELLDTLKACGNIEVDGVFTHFATAADANAGAGNDFTRLQFARFQEGLAQIRDAGFSPRYIHCCNTGASTWFDEARKISTHVRVGSLYLGYSSVQDDWNPVGVEESGTWKTSIVNIRQIMPGESAGYGRSFMPDHPAKLAVIGIGYGDGYTRSFAVNGAPVLIRGRRCPFVGTSMDMSFIDVTGVDCGIGDEVTLFGEDGCGNRISGLEIGHLMGETRLAMFSHITERVERVYIRKDS